MRKGSMLANKKLLAVLLIGIVGVAAFISLFIYLRRNRSQIREVGGTLTQDDVWSGHIMVSNTVTVPQGITLTISPGTVVEFKHYRGYKELAVVGLEVSGGTITAIGTAAAPIWFTSDAENPLNGDWNGISCMDTNTTVFKYVIVEFAHIGIEQFQSAVNVSHSIIRWVNTEGLYAEQSHPTFEYNRIYGNAYHEIALEQFNYDVMIRYNIFQGSHFGIHCEATNVTVMGNYFVNYSYCGIDGGQFSNYTIINNTFENVCTPISLTATTTNVTSGNDFYGNGSLPRPALDLPDLRPRELGYIPGDPEDQYMYVFDALDETRNVTRHFWNEGTFGFSLTYANNCLWRFDHRSITKGAFMDFVRINISTGENATYGNDFLANPRGLCYDGAFFWVNDFTLKRIYKFKINASNQIEIHASFNIPSKDLGGLVALATDGTFLYTPSRNQTFLYNISKSGTLVGAIPLQLTAGSITWTGDYFWAVAGGVINKFHPNGTLAGRIYSPAWEPIGITWDGSYLWTVCKTCELWFDAKIFRIAVLNDQILL
jgi:hypothetical protein